MDNPLGIHYGSFVTNWNEDQHHLIPKVKELGFDLLEFGAPWLMDQNEQSITEFRKRAEGEGVLLATSLGLSAEQDISSEDSVIRQAGVAFLTDLAKRMARVGAKCCSGIIHGPWNERIDSYEEKPSRWANSVMEMKKASKVFESEGVYFNVEVVNRFENFLINDSREVVQYLEEVDSPNLLAHLDTFHMNIEEDSFVEALSTVGSRLGHFHIGENNRKLPGTGMLPWKEIFSNLKAIDYKRPIAMEPFVRPGGEVGSAISLFRDLVDLSSYEEDIKRSVMFVRNLMA